MEGINKFLVFNPTGTNTMSDSDYSTNSQRLTTGVNGVADASLHNKIFKQTTTMASALGNLIENNGGTASDDDINALQSALSNLFTMQGNTFNSANNLIQADSDGSYPSLDASKVNVSYGGTAHLLGTLISMLIANYATLIPNNTVKLHNGFLFSPSGATSINWRSACTNNNFNTITIPHSFGTNLRYISMVMKPLTADGSIIYGNNQLSITANLTNISTGTVTISGNTSITTVSSGLIGGQNNGGNIIDNTKTPNSQSIFSYDANNYVDLSQIVISSTNVVLKFWTSATTANDPHFIMQYTLG